MTVEKEYSKLRNKALISSQNYILKPTDSNKQEMIKANENFERLCADIEEKIKYYCAIFLQKKNNQNKSLKQIDFLVNFCPGAGLAVANSKKFFYFF